MYSRNKLENLIWNPVQIILSAWIQTGILWDIYLPICSIPRFIGVLIWTMAEMPPQKQWEFSPQNFIIIVSRSQNILLCESIYFKQVFFPNLFSLLKCLNKNLFLFLFVEGKIFWFIIFWLTPAYLSGSYC